MSPRDGGRHFGTIVIGAGQAGLAASYHPSARGNEHVVARLAATKGSAA